MRAIRTPITKPFAAIMKVNIFLLAFLTLYVLILGCFAQSQPCTTPTRQPGMCVRIERCKNIYRIITSPTPMPLYDKYIKRAACTLPGVPRNICCQPTEVGPEPTTTTPPPLVGNVNLLPTDCGQMRIDRLVFSNVTKVFEYPWMALLRYETNGTFVDGCDGSIIHKRYVMTAAHCLKTRSTMRIDHVILGEHTRSTDIDCNIYRDYKGEAIEWDCADAAEQYKVESFDIHPEYDQPKFANDIGLVRLKKDITWKEQIQPLCLPVTEELRTNQFERYLVTGWGATENQTGSDLLLKAVVPRVSNEICQQRMVQNRLNIHVTEHQMCTDGQDLVDTCNGDSGGLLGMSSNFKGVDRFVQYGVVSVGVDSCDRKSIPRIYTRVVNYMNWILNNIQP